MKEILSNPLFLPLIASIALLYLLIVFAYVSKSKVFASILEKTAVFLFIFTIYNPSIASGIFSKYLHPDALAMHTKTLPSAAVQLGFYVAVIFVLIPRLRHTTKNFLQVLSIVIIQDPFLFILLLMISLSALWSETPIATLKWSCVILGTTTVSAYIGKQYQWQDLYRILCWLGAGLTILSFVKNTKHGKGWAGIFGHPNQLGGSMALISTLWIWQAVNSPKQRWLSLGIAAASLLLLQNANSAGAKVQVVVLISLLIYLRFIKSLSSKWAFVAVVLFLILVSIAAILITENIETIVVDTLGKDMTFTGRRPLWELLWKQEIKSHLWLGHGYHSFWQPWRGLDDPGNDVVMPNGWKAPHAHNGFVEILLELGLVGFVLFMLSFFTTLARAVLYFSQSKQPESVLPMILLTFLILPNLTLSRLLEVGDIWCYYIISVVRLSLDTRGMTFNDNPRKETYESLKSQYNSFPE
jgi:O-antigen ligase